MEKIASFTIDHIKLKPGVYVSRKDHVGAEVITTFDLRMTSPNDEPVMNTAEVHTIEHLGATFLRNHPDFGTKTLGQWAAAPDFTCFLPEMTPPEIFFLWLRRCSPLSVIFAAKYQGPLQRTAAIIWI